MSYYRVIAMVQNGAKYNRGLKRWELPLGSKPTARMGVQGGEGEDSIPPLGLKAAALQKDAERNAKLEAEAGSYSPKQVLRDIEKADNSTDQGNFDRVIDKYRSSANKTVASLEDNYAGLYEGWIKTMDRIKDIQGQISKENDRRVRASGRRAAKRRSADNPYGLSGDGRSENKYGEKGRSLDRTLSKTQERLRRIEKQLEKTQNQIVRMSDIYGTDKFSVVAGRAAQKAGDKLYPE